jgi:hypothetical protein
LISPTRRATSRPALYKRWCAIALGLCAAAGSMSVHAQTAQVLMTLVANHGSLAAGDVVFTNFRLLLLQPGQLLPLGDTFPVLYDGADVAVRASVVPPRCSGRIEAGSRSSDRHDWIAARVDTPPTRAR